MTSREHYEKNREKILTRLKEKYRSIPLDNFKRKWIFDSHLKARYKITAEDYVALFEKQRGKCAICDKYREKLDIDHNHVTRKIRGLICRRCNLFVAFLETGLLPQALAYLGVSK